MTAPATFASDFVLTEAGVLFPYTDRAGERQVDRDRAGDEIAGILMAQRGGRVALGSLSTHNPGRVTSFTGVTGNALFSIYCKGYCKNLVFRLRGTPGRHLGGSVSVLYPLPVIEVVEPTYYPATVSFEVDAAHSDLSQPSEITVTQWGSESYKFRPGFRIH